MKEKAPAQGEIRDATQDVQQRAANDAPDAAASLNEAANQMEKAQKELARSKNAPEAQQSAVEALKKAERELDEKISKLEQDEKQLAALEKLLEKVEVIIKDEQAVRLDPPVGRPSFAVAVLEREADAVAERCLERLEHLRGGRPRVGRHGGAHRRSHDHASAQVREPGRLRAREPVPELA